MTKKTPEQLRVGMVLAQDIHDAHGMLVMPAGVALQSSDLLALVGLGDVSVEVEETGQADNASVLDGKSLMQAQHELDDAFRFAGLAHPMMQELHRLCVMRRAHRLKRV